MKNYTIALLDKKIAKSLIMANHYSHKWTSCRYALGLFCEDDLCGVAVYGFPVGRQVVKSIASDLNNEDVLELTRLWLRDEEPRNSESYFLGRTFDWLRKNTKVRVLISYSDPMHNHVGIIYQATNWWYQGNNMMLIKGYLHKVKGEILHPRTCVAKYGTIKEKELRNICPDYERIELKKKHRYLYVLHNKDRTKIKNVLKHPIIPYVKNNENCSWTSKLVKTKQENKAGFFK